MSDFPCTVFNQIIPIQKLGLVDSYTLRIEAKSASLVKRVVVNGVDATNIVIASNTTVYAAIPDSQINSVLSTITLIGESNEAAIISFNVKSTTQMNDSLYVLQRFMRLLLMTKGSNAFSPESGASLQASIGEDISRIQTNAVLAIKDAEQQLLDMQSVTLSPSKTLSVVEILNISYSINTLTVSIELMLVMEDGSTVTTNFGVAGA